MLEQDPKLDNKALLHFAELVPATQSHPASPQLKIHNGFVCVFCSLFVYTAHLLDKSEDSKLVQRPLLSCASTESREYAPLFVDRICS